MPEEAGGANLPAVALVGVNEELGYTCVPFTFPPDSPNLHMLLATANPEQRKKYLEPYAAGETTSAIAISEPGAGGDPAGMKTRAVKQGDDWVINGRKIWISRIAKADFTIVMAVTDPEKGSRGGITAFLVDKGTPGLVVARAIPMLAGQRTYEVVFEDCKVHESQVLGRIGAGLRADAAPPHHPPPADGIVVLRHDPARARHADRARQPARDLRPEARRPAGDPVVGAPTPPPSCMPAA